MLVSKSIKTTKPPYVIISTNDYWFEKIIKGKIVKDIIYLINMYLLNNNAKNPNIWVLIWVTILNIVHFIEWYYFIIQ